MRGNLGSGRSLGIPSISLEIKVKFPKTLEIGGACVQTSWPRTWACRRTRGASWRPSRGQAVTWESSGQKTSASRLDCLARQRLGGQWRWTRAVLLEGNRFNSFNFPKSPKVGPKLGEQCRTQVTTSASSGDLQPTLGEEPCAPSGARSDIGFVPKCQWRPSLARYEAQTLLTCWCLHLNKQVKIQVLPVPGRVNIVYLGVSAR